MSYESGKLHQALAAEGVKLAEDVFNRVVRRLENPAGCEQCGQRTKMAVEKPDGSLRTACCGTVVVPAPTRKKVSD